MARIDYYFTTVSPFVYLAGVRLEDIAARHGAEITYKPVDAQALFAVCRRKLESNFVPSFIQVLSAIPKTASEKPQDRFLIEALYSDPASVHTERR